ncbi:hypothetical protein GGR21_003516 [Dysgonomonas hofstadii]|uniref:Lipoprotein n=1 Tax=Dysgonomonas hofstadii TaxID=637886 RepID=A0A840CQ91_9BACT|nr:hypothetical protein [Dysgonomonas hofstadii]MBB4037596.1 hypothetical protein [Dysgonomonas hofstadii]
MKHLLTVSILLLTLFSCKEKQGIEIRWTDNLEGDFSFTQEWSYPENVFLNEYGELVCNGLCDTILDKMRDENGRIIKDSITHYYQLLDTTHHYYTLHSEAHAHEWAGTNYAEAYKGKTIQ